MDIGQARLNWRGALAAAALLGLAATACGQAPAGSQVTAGLSAEITAWPTTTERARPSASPAPATASPDPTPDLEWVLNADLAQDAGYRDPPSLQFVASDRAWIRFQPDTELAIQIYFWPADDPSAVRWIAYDPAAHGVVLLGLVPETDYVAQPILRSGETTHRLAFMGEPWPAVRFRTAAEQPQVVRFGVIGDSGYGDPVTAQLVGELARRDLDFVVHTGDIVYRADENDGVVPAYGLKFYRVFEPLLTTAPIYPVMGNHEFDLPVRWDDLPYYYQAFPRFPAELDLSSGGHQGRDWYAIEQGPWQFLFLNTQLFFGVPGSKDQLEWLRSRLEGTPPRASILAMHVPPYSAGRHQGDAAWVAANLSEYLSGYSVAMTLAGHDHNYQRILRDGVQHFVSGGGSRVLYDTGSAPWLQAAARRSHVLLVELRMDGAEIVAVDQDGVALDHQTFPIP